MRIRRFAPILLLFTLVAAPAQIVGAASAAPPENPMVSDILSRMRKAGGAQSDPAKRESLFRDAALQLPRALYPGLLDAAAAAPGTLDYEIARAVFLRWAWETPDFAAAWVAASQPGPFRQETLAEAAGRWAATDPDGAARWARHLPEADRLWVFSSARRFMISTEMDPGVASQTPTHSER